jgi:5-(carboxyamino)imidazole ribonucleotide synthase
MRIGILGGGQLGRMLALAGYPLGLQFRFLDNDLAPAGDVGELITGEFEDESVLARFAQGLDVATFEFENVPEASARSLAAHVPVYPPAAALHTAQDRLNEKTLFRRLGIPTPPFQSVDHWEDLERAIARIGLPAVLKTRRLGYDGKGQVVLRSAEDVENAWETLGGVPLILEGFIPFERELSILAVRGRGGETAFYPLVQNEHRGGILRLSVAPASGIDDALQAKAETLVGRVLEALDYVGVLALELFEVGGDLLANEIAPRVHNSGHWTIEGAVCSQFENHLRAILGWPLGSTRAVGHSAMINLIGSAPPEECLLSWPEAHLHLYGKAPRPGRKIGHLTVCSPSAAERDSTVSGLRALVDRADEASPDAG